MFIQTLGTVLCSIYLFACIAFWSLLLGADDFENHQELYITITRQVTLDYIDPKCFLSLVHILAYML
jgi:hypothetical protein